MFGYIHFDNTNLYNQGFVCSTSIPIHRLGENETGELDNEHIWLTNLDFDIMRASGMLSNVKYRRCDFLGERIKSLSERLGFFEDPNDRNRMIEFIQMMPNVFERVVKYVEKYIGITEIHKDTLKNGIRESLLNYPDPIQVPASRVKSFEEANQSFTSTLKEFYQKGTETLPLYVNPDFECDFLFDQYYPTLKAHWELKTFRKNDFEFLNELRKNKRVALVRIKVSDFSLNFDRLFNFGSSTSNRGMKQWVTLEEAILLSTEAKSFEMKEVLYTKDVFKPDSYKAIKENIPKKVRYSLSGLILLQNLWSSMAIKMSGKVNNNCNSRVNTISSFLRYYDRFFCLSYALELIRKNVNISGYGAGKIYIQCDNMQSIHILTAAREVGLLPPLLNVEPEEDDVKIEDVKTPLAMQQLLWGRGERDVILEYDKKCFSEVFK